MAGQATAISSCTLGFEAVNVIILENNFHYKSRLVTSCVSNFEDAIGCEQKFDTSKCAILAAQYIRRKGDFCGLGFVSGVN